MKKALLIRIAAALSALICLIPLCALSGRAEDGADKNDPDISISITASPATAKINKLTESGTLTTSSVQTVFNVFVKDARQRSLLLICEINGTKRETAGKYFHYACEKPEDYGVMTVTVFDAGTGGNETPGERLAVYTFELVYNGEAGFFAKKWSDFKRDFYLNFIDKENWKFLLRGLGNTLIITACALIIGILIGTVVAAICSTYDKNKEMYALRGGFLKPAMAFANGACQVYLTVIRGTPVVVQLLIMYFVIFASGKNDLFVAILAFGINSGAYVAEILRGGILSIDPGQFEAGRSLGFSYVQTMIHIIIPQMFKSSLPALCNEFISLLKETSVAGYVPIIELTKAGNIIRAATYSAFLPLIAVALIYLAMVMILTRLVKLLERRLRKSER